MGNYKKREEFVKEVKELKKELKRVKKELAVPGYVQPFLDLVESYPPALRPIIEAKIDSRVKSFCETVVRESQTELRWEKKELYHDRLKQLQAEGCPKSKAMDVLHFEANRCGQFGKGNAVMDEAERKFWLAKLPPCPF